VRLGGKDLIFRLLENMNREPGQRSKSQFDNYPS